MHVERPLAVGPTLCQVANRHWGRGESALSVRGRPRRHGVVVAAGRLGASIRAWSHQTTTRRPSSPPCW
eukprot:5081901-Prymnesium_polylepis.1